jgi:hypothetical protein
MSSNSRTTPASEQLQPGVAAVLERADALVADGRLLDAIDLLCQANRESPHAAQERRLAQVRHAAFGHLGAQSSFDEWPVRNGASGNHVDNGPAHIPEITRGELDADLLRRNILGHGSLRVNNLLDGAQVDRFVTGIQQALDTRDEGIAAESRRDQSWYAALPLPRDEAKTLGRHWVAGSGGVLAADSPRLLYQLFETFDEVGLREVVQGYLGERPVLSANKCTLRRVPIEANTDWHQDGAFLGRGIRALNVWIALSDCGVDSPGIDLLPRRLDHIVETGTGGAIFDWAVGPAVVEQLAVDAPVVRPVFNAGDALLFDDMFLHRTAVDSGMTRPRYAIEAWFFAPTSYPAGQVPIVW